MHKPRQFLEALNRIVNLLHQTIWPFIFGFVFPFVNGFGIYGAPKYFCPWAVQFLQRYKMADEQRLVHIACLKKWEIQCCRKEISGLKSHNIRRTTDLAKRSWSRWQSIPFPRNCWGSSVVQLVKLCKGTMGQGRQWFKADSGLRQIVRWCSKVGDIYNDQVKADSNLHKQMTYQKGKC